MVTSVQSSEKILVYDGDCPMCTATVARLLRMGLVKREQAVSNHDLTGDDLQAAQAAGIRNQLVVIDPRSRETRAGADALVWIIADNTNHPALVNVLSLPGLRHLLRWGYETISYNRRIISPPRHQIQCDCEPDVTLGRRLMLIVPLLLATFALAGWFGAAVFVAAEWSAAASGVLVATVAVGALVGVLALAAGVLLAGEQRMDYVAHLSVTTFVGSLWLVPASLIGPFAPGRAAIALAGLSLVVGLGLMLKMQRRRVAAIGLSAGWLAAFAAAWCAALAVGASLAL